MGFKCTCMGMFISDSGSVSILKSVLANEGLSGIRPFEHEVRIRGNERQATRKSFAERLDMLFQGKRFKVLNGDRASLISKILLLILNGRWDFFDQNQ